jgi:hypothetical protein
MPDRRKRITKQGRNLTSLFMPIERLIRYGDNEMTLVEIIELLIETNEDFNNEDKERVKEIVFAKLKEDMSKRRTFEEINERRKEINKIIVEEQKNRLLELLKDSKNN